MHENTPLIPSYNGMQSCKLVGFAIEEWWEIAIQVFPGFARIQENIIYIQIPANVGNIKIIPWEV